MPISEHPKIFLDSQMNPVVNVIILNLGIEMDQRIDLKFGCGFFFNWFYWFEVCPPPGS